MGISGLFRKRFHKHKFGAVRTERDGKKFPSKLEARYYDKLVKDVADGHVIFFLRQVGFDLTGGVRYFADFMVFKTDGDIEIIDCKGQKTPMSNLKVKQVETLYPVTIKIVTAKDF